MKPFLLALLSICFTESNAQNEIKLEELKIHQRECEGSWKNFGH